MIEQNKKLQIFVNIMFCHSMIPIINKTSRVTKKSVNNIRSYFHQFFYHKPNLKEAL